MKLVLTTILALACFLSMSAQAVRGYRTKTESYLESVADTIYLHSHHNLQKIGGFKCNEGDASFNSTTNFGDSICIYIKIKKIDLKKHTIAADDTMFKFIHNQKRVDYIKSTNLIDGKYAYGVDGTVPKYEVEELKIRWAKKWLNIPKSAFHNLYDVHLCKSHIPLEAYVTNNNKLLYIYFWASDGAGSYSAKLVFNRSTYITRIINSNEMQSDYDFLDGITN